MHPFWKDTRGDVNQRVIIIAVIVVIALYFFAKEKAVMKCSQEKIDRGLLAVLFDKEHSQESCSVNAQDGTQTGSATENGGSSSGDGSTTVGGSNGDGSIGSGSGSGSSNEGGTTETGDSISMTDKEKAVPISHYDTGNVDLTCSNSYASYDFTIPEGTPSWGVGTKSITIKNSKVWDMWMKVKSTTGKNGLVITSDDSYYRKIPSGAQMTFDIGWKWNVSADYKGDLGSADVYFQVTCSEPPASEMYKPVDKAPSNFKVDNVGDTAISLSWDKINTISEYLVYRNGLLVYKGTANSYRDENLLPGTTYSYQLFTSVTKGTDTYVSLTQKTTGVSPVPLPVTGFRVSGATADTLHIQWNAASKATHYRVFLDGVEKSLTPWSDSILRGLQPNRQYKLEVISENSYGGSEKAVYYASTNPTAIYANPTNFRQTMKSTNSMSLAWDAKSGATRYVLKAFGKVYYDGPNTNVTLTGLSAGGGYHFFLYAYYPFGVSSGVFTTFSTAGYSTPTPPSNISISNVTNTSFTVKWNKGGASTGSIVKINGKEIYRGENTSLNVTDLTPNTYYKVDIYSYNPEKSNNTPSYATTFTTNDTYDEVANLSATCDIEKYTKTFTFPTPIKVGESGVFMLNLTNNSSSKISFNIDSIIKSGDLFQGSTPMKIDYEDLSALTIEPKERIAFPIRWILPSNASNAYTQKTGTIGVYLSTSCPTK